MSISSKRGEQPRFDWSSSSAWYALYYIVFMFVASLCSIQLFIGVILETFKRRRGISSLTNTQRQFQDLQRQLALIKPSRKIERPTNAVFFGVCYDIVVDKGSHFTRIVSIVLMFNLGI